MTKIKQLKRDMLWTPWVLRSSGELRMTGSLTIWGIARITALEKKGLTERQIEKLKKEKQKMLELSILDWFDLT